MSSFGTYSKFGAGSAVNTAFGLGTTFGLGLGLFFLSDSWFDFGLYMVFHSFFHLWEYSYVAMFHPRELTTDSFLINHSQLFYIAWVVAWCEYLLESWLFPSIKGIRLLIFLGFVVCLLGQGIRTLSMYTAGTNFHHLVREEKEKGHKLVTFGIYQYLRHPAYFGWFYWAVGLQLILCNPLSFVLYAFAAWRFFEDRIREEERTLVEFFADDYVRYRAQTPVGIPFIS